MKFLALALSKVKLEWARQYVYKKLLDKPWLEDESGNFSAFDIRDRPRAFRAAIEQGLLRYARGESPRVRSTCAYLTGRDRILYKFDLADFGAHALLAHILSEQFDSELGEGVWSYRKGRSSLLAARHLRKFLSEHRKTNAVKERGLFVLRRDVARFGDSIALNDGCHLEEVLTETLEKKNFSDARMAARLILNAVRLVAIGLVDESGQATAAQFCPRLGIPTGSPLVPPLLNIFLQNLDRKYVNLDGGLYVRFGDDILFAHKNEDVATFVRDEIPQDLKKHRVRLNSKKSSDIFWSGSGFVSAKLREQGWKGDRFVEYLGLKVSFQGQISLPTKKIREMKTDLRHRLDSFRQYRNQGLSELGFEVGISQLVGDFFDLDSGLSLPHIDHLFREVDDRRFLNSMDQMLWFELARALVGKKVRPFRSLSPRRLRARLHLPSFTQLRNRGRSP